MRGLARDNVVDHGVPGLEIGKPYGRVSGGKLGDRPEAGTESQYLLTGFIECAPL